VIVSSAEEASSDEDDDEDDMRGGGSRPPVLASTCRPDLRCGKCIIQPLPTVTHARVKLGDCRLLLNGRWQVENDIVS
jgi:hypothetical protein